MCQMRGQDQPPYDHGSQNEVKSFLLTSCAIFMQFIQIHQVRYIGLKIRITRNKNKR